jgi:beta-glucosidase
VEAQVTLWAGKSANAQLKIDPAAPTHPLSYYDAASHQWRIAPGTYRVYVGTSERDTPLMATFTVSSP